LYFGSAIARRFKNSPDPKRLRWYFTHFNNLPALIHSTDAERSTAFHDFDLAARLGYSVRTDTFTGDWIAAAKIYRKWVISTPAPFIRNRPLRTPGYLDDFLKNTGYGYRRQLTLDTTDPAYPGIDPEVEYAKDQALLSYYANVLQDGYG